MESSQSTIALPEGQVADRMKAGRRRVAIVGGWCRLRR